MRMIDLVQTVIYSFTLNPLNLMYRSLTLVPSHTSFLLSVPSAQLFGRLPRFPTMLVVLTNKAIYFIQWSFGGLGVRCRDLVNMIAEEGALNRINLLNGLKVKTVLLRALSCALQGGNALIDIEGSKRARERLGRS